MVFLRWFVEMIGNCEAAMCRTDGLERAWLLEVRDALKKLEESFEMLHQAYQEYRAPGKDATEEAELVEKQDQHYFEVIDKIYESLQLVAEYEKSYEIYQASQPDPELANTDLYSVLTF